MDRKGSTLSSTDSFYFQLCPAHFKVEHAFAKTIKNGCIYRLVIYKGIQKMDEMAEGVRGKLIGGRIIFENTSLGFYLPIFTPSRNIEFTVKVLESKPNEQEVEIAQHKIKSGDHIKSLLNEGTAVFHEQVQLLDSFVLVFDLFVQGSKEAVDQLVKEHKSRSKVQEKSRINRINTPNKAASEVLSQSDLSEHSREGGMLNSKKKLSRKRGHDGKMKSRHGSRENSQISSREGSVRSSKKAFGPFPHPQQGQNFVHSPKKASPPKVEETSPAKSQPAKTQNLVSVGRKDSNASEIYIPKVPLSPTMPVKIESNIQHSESARKNPFSQRSDILPNDTPVPIRRQPIARREEAAKAASPRNVVHDLEIKGTQKLFEIQQKREDPVTSSLKNKEAYPPKNPTASRLAKTTPISKIDDTKTEKNAEYTQIIQITDADLSPPDPSPASKVSQPKQPPQNEDIPQEQSPRQPSQPRAPSAKASTNSRAAFPILAVEGKQALDQDIRGIPQLKFKQSMNWRQNSLGDVDTKVEESATKEYQSTKDTLFYVFFFIVSAFMFYNAVTPSRRV